MNNYLLRDLSLRNLLLFSVVFNIYSTSFSSSLDIWNSSMGCNEKLYKIKYNANFKRYHHINFLKNLFLKNFQNKQTNNIPKIIHQIWVGNKKIPKEYLKFAESWKKHHPEWEYKLWTDKEVSSLKLYNRDQYYKTTDPREKADILRLELLHQFGGLYVDMDFHCIRSFDEIHSNIDFYTGICPHDTDHILANGLIASTKSHPIIQKCIVSLKKYSSKSTIWSRTGPQFFTECFFEVLKDKPNISALAYPTSYFYSIPLRHGLNKSYKKCIKNNSFAVHIWGNRNGFNN